MFKRLIALAFFLILTAQPANAQWWAMSNYSSQGACISGNDAQTVLLIHSNNRDGSNTFDDSGAAATCPHAITANNNVHHETDAEKFGASSIYFDGTNDYLSLGASGDWDFGADNFTIATWVKTSSVSLDARIIQHFQAGGGDGWLLRIASGAINFMALGTGIDISTGAGQNDNTWRHVAVVRNGNDFILYINGVATAGSSSAAAINNLAFGMHIGCNSDESADYEGYQDEIIIKKGTAEWTTDFTPPSLPYCD